jgi:hypothetical protein
MAVLMTASYAFANGENFNEYRNDYCEADYIKIDDCTRPILVL